MSGHFQPQLGLFTSGTLIKSYITRKPPIAPNSKQLGQLLLPAKAAVEASGGDCVWKEGSRGIGLILSKDISWCSCGKALYRASGYKASVRWGVKRDRASGEHWRNHWNIWRSKNSACQMPWYFFNEETSSHFPPEGLETKAKVQLKILKTFFKLPNSLSVYALLPLKLFFPWNWGAGGGKENILFWWTWPVWNVQKHTFVPINLVHLLSKAYSFPYQSFLSQQWRRMFY